MNKQHLQRLREEQQLAISQTQEKIQALNKFRGDYVCLQERLATLPNRITHNVMVPFGKKAFIPGQLVHTNEILVLLGENWFVDRSAKQASETVHRRLTVLDKQISELKEQLGLLTPRLDFTSELQGIAEEKGDVVEITEEYDAEKEKSWRERHAASVREYNAQLRQEYTQAMKEEEEEEDERQRKAREHEKSESELWARLDELELQEQDACELDQPEMSQSENSESEEQEGDDSSESEEESHQKVKWKDATQPVRKTRANVIRFSHTPRTLQVLDDAQVTSSSDQTVTSPADIYKQFSTHGPKSILKPSTASTTGQQHPVIHKKSQETEVQQGCISSGTENAFSGTVVEKKTEDSKIAHVTTITDTDLDDSQAQPKKVSKFKARRMQAKQ